MQENGLRTQNVFYSNSSVLKSVCLSVCQSTSYIDVLCRQCEQQRNDIIRT